MINFELYKVFYYVAEAKNISRAAEQLYISQPAVSKSIRKLEALTGCTLFFRSQKGVSLTSEGKILYQYVQKAFLYLNGGEQVISRIRKLDAGSVRIGISNTLCRYCLFPYLEAFHQTYPHIAIKIMNQPTPDTCALLESGGIDFGIISRPASETGFRYTRLMSIHDIFVSNQPCSADILSVHELCLRPLMLMEKENQTRSFIDEYMRQNKKTAEPEIEVGSMEFLIELARIGIGTACVIREFVTEELHNQTLYQLPVMPAPPPREVGIVRKNKIPVSRASRQFMDFLIKEYQSKSAARIDSV